MRPSDARMIRRKPTWRNLIQRQPASAMRSKGECYGTWYSALAAGGSDPGDYSHRTSLPIRGPAMTEFEIMTLAGDEITVGNETSAPAVSWSPIVAGSIVAVASSLVLLLMGSGLGLTMVSPWSHAGVSPATFAVSTVIWLIVVQWLSSALGGYLTGRLRKRWAGVHPDEVFFRDTAHGLLAWALATVLVAGVLSSAASAIVMAGAGAATSLVTGTAQGAGQASTGQAPNGLGLPVEYYVDLMFRPPADSSSAASPAAASQNAADPRTEASRILLMSLASSSMPATDRNYLAQLVSIRTGRTAADAQQHVTGVLAQIEQVKAKAKETADAARKAGISTSLFMVLSLIIGAFVASAAAALGGRVRDEV